MKAATAAYFPATLGGFDLRRTAALRTDVLVVGAGIAGCSAALAAADRGASVLLVSKVPLTETNTAWAQGGMAAVLDDSDSVALHIADTIRVGAGLTNPAIASLIVGESAATVRTLEELGVHFDITDTGRLQLSREGGHSVSRVVHSNGDSTGAEIQRALSEQVRGHPRITFREGAFTRDLLMVENRCVGALILIAEIELAVEAHAVVLASGGAGQVFRETTNPIGACGDGLGLGFRAGATLSGMEFVQFHPTTLYIAGASRFLISEVVRGAGATLKDRHGERFMVEVHPDAELAPRDVVSRAILDRMVATGDTHVYLDLATVRGDPRTLFPTINRICASFDINIAEDPVPVRPGAHYMIGGIVTDAVGRTNVAGLYAAGEVASTGLHGANRLASNSLLEGAVIGRNAGMAAADEARSHRAYVLPQHVAPQDPVINAPRIHLEDMLYSLKSLMWREVGLKRSGHGLSEARSRIHLWHHYLLRANLRGRQVYELANMLTVSALIATAAEVRLESRGTHYRNDFPKRDDAGWCREIYLLRGPEGDLRTMLSDTTSPTDMPTP